MTNKKKDILEMPDHLKLNLQYAFETHDVDAILTLNVIWAIHLKEKGVETKGWLN
jgi:hypothetical protein